MNEKDCCEVWPKIIHHFRWFAFAEEPENETRIMPCLGENHWRVNFCPACGADRRGVEETVSHIEQAVACEP
jgi:hypothetical protein